ncbi:unnamed protein product [Candidula unifasciata]|uniref:Uncharacterized protein n=1 Tax=Candidula unifasciata TaxID=100452 RepID=A0A8S3ZA86_9EUPU|nr:unnamed protein product [Candidula unifasciata]
MLLKVCVTLLCGFLFASASATEYECPYKACYCEGNTIMCTDMGLNSTPKIINNYTPQITTLYLDLNQITTIPSGSIPANLTEIILDDNPIITISNDAFVESADTLQTLSFSGALFTDIPRALTPLRVLKYFGLYNSKVRNWDEEVMKSIGANLESLTLQNAGVISSLSWIRYFPNLMELIIEGCSISYLPDNVLDKLTDRLVTVSFASNSLNEIPRDFSKLTNIQKLDLGNNKISNITWLPRSKLKALVLNNNRIKDATPLSNVLRSAADSLETLTLQVNQLEFIPELEFLNNLLKLDLTYNRISDPHSGSMPANMFALDLGNNHLPYIPWAMSNLTRLQDLTMISNFVRDIEASNFPQGVIWVHLGYNIITELNVADFPPNSTIQYLHLNNNPIGHISTNAFENLPNVNLINLAGTHITRLPLALATVNSLIVFDATDCAGLVCTCQEKRLASLFIPLMPGDIHGDCGVTSIYDFFANFSSGCP